MSPISLSIVLMAPTIASNTSMVFAGSPFSIDVLPPSVPANVSVTFDSMFSTAMPAISWLSGLKLAGTIAGVSIYLMN